MYKGIDIKDIQLVIQWKFTCNMETLWQRFGRGARDPDLEALAIFFVESKFFDKLSQPQTMVVSKTSTTAVHPTSAQQPDASTSADNSTNDVLSTLFATPSYRKSARIMRRWFLRY